MTNFEIKITADPNPAVRASQQVDAALTSVEKEAADLRAALTQAFAQRDNGTAASLERISTILEETQTQALITDARLGQIGRDLQKTEKQASNTGVALKAAFAGLSLGLIAREFVTLSDELTNVQNRVRIVTESEQELADVQQQLFDISERTRSSFGGTAETFSRIAVSAKELGRTNQQLLQFTESLNQAIILSGASAQEAQAGLIQLSQGLASGALRGDELRSVLEQLPAVADVIAKSLGVTRGELRKLGQDGKITADVVIKAFDEARASLADRFATTVPTISQAFVVLKNNVAQTVGDFNAASGASELLARSLLLLSDNAPAIVASLGGIATAFAAITVQQLAASASTAKLVAQFGPLVGVAAAIAAVGGEVVNLTEDIKAAREVELAASTLTPFQALGSQIVNAKKELAQLNRVLEQTGGTNEFVAARIEATKARLDALTGALKTSRDAAAEKEQQDARQNATTKALLDTLAEEATLLRLSSGERAVQQELLKAGDELRAKGIEINAAANESLRAEIEAAIRQNDALKSQAEAFDKIRGPQETYARQLQALQGLLDAGRITVDEYTGAVDRLTAARDKANASNGGTDPFAAQLASLRASNEELTIQANNTGVAAAALKIELELRRQGVTLTREQQDELAGVLLAQEDLNKKIQERNELDRKKRDAARDAERDLETQQREAEQLRAQVDVIGQLEERKQRLLELGRQEADLMPQIAKAVADLRLQQLDASEELGAGFERAFLRIQAEADDLAAVGEKVTNVFADQATDALIQFAKTGKFAFNDFAGAVLEDLQRILIRLLVVQAISALIPGAGAAGGASTAVNAVVGGLNQGRESGGTVQPGQRPFPVGEAGPELFVPNRTGTIVPNPASTPAEASKTGVTVVNVSDESMIAQYLASGRADDVIINRLNANKDRLNQAT